ncbi:MAG: hypothetical protein FWE82_04075 [Defluviitaleaceae bacterium]|nr:hypothetical protein [Defluviitaleaceae bacterium]
MKNRFTSFYIGKHIKSNSNFILLTLLIFCLLACVSVLRGAHIGISEGLRALETDFDIWMEVSDHGGINTDIETKRLTIQNHIVRLFTRGNDYGGIFQFIENVCLRSTVTAYAGGQMTYLTGINRQEAENSIMPESGVRISFFNGSSWEDFLQDQAVCLIPSHAYGSGQETVSVVHGGITTVFTVIGLVYGQTENKIYCPWIFLQEEGYESADVLRATVKDNTRLNEMKTVMKQYFIGTDSPHVYGGPSYALIIFDSSYIESHKSMTKNLELINMLTPVFFAFVFLIGIMSEFLLVRHRKHEYALLRAIGVFKRKTAYVFLSEYFFVCASAAIFYSLAVLPVSALNKGYAYIPPVLACFFAGMIILIVNFMKKSELIALQHRE